MLIFKAERDDLVINLDHMITAQRPNRAEKLTKVVVLPGVEHELKGGDSDRFYELIEQLAAQPFPKPYTTVIPRPEKPKPPSGTLERGA